VNRGVRFMLAPCLLIGRAVGWPRSKWTPSALLPIPISRAIHRFKVTHYPRCWLVPLGCAIHVSNLSATAKAVQLFTLVESFFLPSGRSGAHSVAGRGNPLCSAAVG
jgi:hypothetical protein